MCKPDLQHVAAKSDPPKPFVRAVTDVHLPEEIAHHLDGIFRLASLPRDFRPMPKVGPANTNAATATPAGLTKFYNVEGSGSASQPQCVLEGLGQYTSPKDLMTIQASESGGEDCRGASGNAPAMVSFDFFFYHLFRHVKLTNPLYTHNTFVADE